MPRSFLVKKVKIDDFPAGLDAPYGRARAEFGSRLHEKGTGCQGAGDRERGGGLWGACRTGPEWILLGSVRLCRLVLLGRVGFCWVALNRIWFCWVPLGRVGFCWVALGSVGLCWLEAEPQRAGPAAFLCAARWNEPSRAEPSGAGDGQRRRAGGRGPLAGRRWGSAGLGGCGRR